MRIRNLLLGLRDQLPVSRLWRNLRKGNLKGLFHERSHLTHEGKPKIAYSSKASSLKAAAKMKQKNQRHYASYKCVHCDGYHIGGSRPI